MVSRLIERLSCFNAKPTALFFVIRQRRRERFGSAKLSRGVAFPASCRLQKKYIMRGLQLLKAIPDALHPQPKNHSRA